MPRPLSHTQLSLFEKCGEAYRRRYEDGDKSPPGVAALRGRSVHTANKVNMQQKLLTGVDLTLPDLVDVTATAFDAEATGGYMLTREEDSRGARLVLGDAKDRAVRLTTLYSREVAPTIQPAMVEQTITLTLALKDKDGNATGEIVALTGVLDLATVEDIIRDLKTSGRRWSARDAAESTQLSWYSLAYKAHTKSWPAGVGLDVLVDVRQPFWQHLATTRDRRDAEVLVRRINVLLAAKKAGIFSPAPVGAWWCSARWCGYFYSCPYVSSERIAAAEANDR